MSKRSILLLIATILLAVAVVWFSRDAEQFSPQQLNELNEKVAPYKVQQNNLETEISDLEKEYEAVVNGKGNLVFIFKELNDKFYSSMKTKMAEKSMTGVMLLSKNQFPGMDNCISMDEFSNLISIGWDYYIAWEEGQTKEEWISYWADKLGEVGLVMPKVVYFDKNMYNEEYEEYLLGNGFEAVVTQGVSGKYMITTGCDEELWDICAIGWNNMEAQNLMQQAVNNGGTIAFTVGFHALGEEYEQDDFNAMIDTLSSYVKRDRIQITDVVEAKIYESTISMEMMEEREIISLKIKEKEEELKSIKDEMKKIYDSYKK